MSPRTILPAAAFRARAPLLGARLEVRTWPDGETLGRLPLAVRLPGDGVAVLFRYAGRTVRTLVDLLNAKHALRVEWYIVALIVVEILLTLYGMWRH